MDSQMRTRVVLPYAAAAGMLALALQFWVFSSALPQRGEYFLTELARGQVGVVSIPVMIAVAFVLGFFARTSAVLIGLSMAAVFPAIAVYEATRYRGSHNLIPFELLAVAVCTVPLMLVAWFGRVMARRAGRDPQPANRPDAE
jgi:hypothetical protein